MDKKEGSCVLIVFESDVAAQATKRFVTRFVHGTVEVISGVNAQNILTDWKPSNECVRILLITSGDGFGFAVLQHMIVQHRKLLVATAICASHGLVQPQFHTREVIDCGISFRFVTLPVVGSSEGLLAGFLDSFTREV